MSEAYLNERWIVALLFSSSPGGRRYQFFGHNYQAEVPDSALPLRHAARTSCRFDGEKTMESFADGIGNLIGFQLVLGFMFSIYLAPSIIAVVRGHHRWPWIGFLNFATGWTVAGWIAALVWSVTGIREPAAIMRIGSAALRTVQPAAV
jgi:Superinfection immunity protein